MNSLIEQGDALFVKYSRDNKSSHLQKAIVLYQKALSFDPNNQTSKFFLGKAHLCLSEFQKSIEYFQSVVAEKDGYYPDALGFIAEAFYGRKNYSESLSYFDRLKQFSDYSDFKAHQLQMYADSLFKLDLLQESLDVCNIISQKNYDSPFADYQRGLIYYKLGNLKDAEFFLDRSEKFYQCEFQNTRSEDSRQRWDTVRAKRQEVKRSLY